MAPAQQLAMNSSVGKIRHMIHEYDLQVGGAVHSQSQSYMRLCPPTNTRSLFAMGVPSGAPKSFGTLAVEEKDKEGKTRCLTSLQRSRNMTRSRESQPPEERAPGRGRT